MPWIRRGTASGPRVSYISPLDGGIQRAEVFAVFKEIDYQGPFMFEAADHPETRGLSPDYVLGKVASFQRAFVERCAMS